MLTVFSCCEKGTLKKSRYFEEKNEKNSRNVVKTRKISKFFKFYLEEISKFWKTKKKSLHSDICLKCFYSCNLTPKLWETSWISITWKFFPSVFSKHGNTTLDLKMSINYLEKNAVAMYAMILDPNVGMYTPKSDI